MFLLTRLKIALESFISANATHEDFSMEMVSSKPILFSTSDSFIKAPNIFMEDKFTHIKFMRESSDLISDTDMVSDTHNNMSMKDNSIKQFCTEQESGEMGTFTKELFSITKCKQFNKLHTEEYHNFLMLKII